MIRRQCTGDYKSMPIRRKVRELLGIAGRRSPKTPVVEQGISISVDEGRAARPDLKIGVCGEHGGDPDSVHFFHHAGIDYCACAPCRGPLALLEAGRAALAPW